MSAAAAWFTPWRRLIAIRSSQLLAYLWLCALGGALLLFAHNAYQRSLRLYAAPLERPAWHFMLPAELSEERAWIWADLLTGTLWYYANKPTFKIGFTDAKTRALAYRCVFERGEPQCIIRDSAAL